MEIQVQSTRLAALRGDLLALGLFQEAGKSNLRGAAKDADRALGGLIGEIIDSKDFLGRAQETFVFHPRGSLGVKRVLLVGLGKKKEFSADAVRLAAATAGAVAQRKRISSFLLIPFGLGEAGGRKISPEAMGQALAEGLILGTYQFSEYKSRPKKGKPGEEERDEAPAPDLKQVTLALPDGGPAKGIAAGVATGRVVSESVVFVRNLANRPSSTHSPAYLAKEAAAMARQVGLRCRVLEKPDMERLGMGGLLGVARG
ncbi:MAG: M17 family peptidase N-terminal domain-containing protein, partial [Vicinamibacteria bacterium]